MTFDFTGPAALLESTDFARRALAEETDRFARAWGAVVCPPDSIALAIRAAPAGGVITLLPGLYKVRTGVTVDKRVRLQGFGRVVIESAEETALYLTGDGAGACGLVLQNATSNTGVTPLVSVSGNRARLCDCTLNSDGTACVNVEGSGCVVSGCRFDSSAAHSGVGDSDVYYANAATNGQTYGNMHSTTRQWVLDYRAVDNMSEAANGRSAIINVR